MGRAPDYSPLAGPTWSYPRRILVTVGVVTLGLLVLVRPSLDAFRGPADRGDNQRPEAEDDPVRSVLDKDGPAASSPPTSDPKVYTYRVVKRYEHDRKSFTQGLLWLNGSMYESTGLYGQSKVRELLLHDDGKMTVVREVQLPYRDFGEGLVHWKGELLQLLWRRSDGIRYQVRAGPGGYMHRIPGQGFKTPMLDGWGLASDGEVLLATDSGPNIYHLDPDDLELLKSVQMKDGSRVIEMPNELEFIDGELWANIFGRMCLARVDHKTGQVLGWVDLTGILNTEDLYPDDILNGIAWDSEAKRLFVTGKRWPTLFAIEVVESPSQDLHATRSRCIPDKNIFRPR